MITRDLEPRHVIYDGHLSHVWYGTFQLAQENNITIIKLPAHITDVLQSLDMSVFKALKDNWYQVLSDRLKSRRIRLTKAEFAEILSSDKVWKSSSPEQKIKNGL